MGASGAFERDTSDGLADYERDILSKWDAGQSISEIIGATGRSAQAVAHVVRLYDDRPDPSPVPALVEANRRFVAAIARMNRVAQHRRAMMPVDLIEEKLKADAENVFRAIFPNARREGAEMCIGSIDGEPGQSLRMRIGQGGKRGWWKDFAGGSGGDVLNLIRDAVCGGDKAEAVRWAKAYLRIDDGNPAAIEQHRVEAAAARKQRERQASDERRAIQAAAVARWQEALELQPGDPVCEYLAARGIDLIAMGRRPGALRYNPELQYGQRGLDGAPPYRGPAMVAMVTSLDGRHIATHRTWLARGADGVWRKAGKALIGVDPRGQPNDPKKVLGSPLGGHIPVWKGVHRHPLRDIPEGTDVYVSEGIEDGLTAAAADPSLRVISMLALSMLPALDLPPQIGRLIILKQNDPPGSDAARLLAKAVAAHRAKGRRVAFVEAPQGVKDLNELAQRAGASGGSDQDEMAAIK